MGASDHELDICSLLEKQEAAMAALYKTYADRFAEHKAIWLKLATAEAAHAGWVRDLRSRVEQGDVQFPGAVRLRSEVIKRAIDNVAAVLLAVNESRLPLADAISAAIPLENSMLEGRWFTLFGGDSALIRRVFTGLANTTEQHVAELRELLAAEVARSHLPPTKPA